MVGSTILPQELRKSKIIVAPTRDCSDAVWAISEDNFGRMYLGTGKGLDQLDLSTGRIRHFNTDDGLAGDIINNCFRDSHGSIWVSTTLGLSKFTPQPDRTIEQRPPIYFSRVRIAGAFWSQRSECAGDAD